MELKDTDVDAELVPRFSVPSVLLSQTETLTNKDLPNVTLET